MSLSQKIAWAIRIVCLLILLILLWINLKPQKEENQNTQNIILEYEIAVLLKNDSTLEIIKHEKINRIDSLPNDSVRNIVANWLEHNR